MSARDSLERVTQQRRNLQQGLQQQDHWQHIGQENVERPPQHERVVEAVNEQHRHDALRPVGADGHAMHAGLEHAVRSKLLAQHQQLWDLPRLVLQHERKVRRRDEERPREEHASTARIAAAVPDTTSGRSVPRASSSASTCSPAENQTATRKHDRTGPGRGRNRSLWPSVYSTMRPSTSRAVIGPARCDTTCSRAQHDSRSRKKAVLRPAGTLFLRTTMTRARGRLRSTRTSNDKPSSSDRGTACVPTTSWSRSVSKCSMIASAAPLTGPCLIWRRVRHRARRAWPQRGLHLRC